MTVSRNTHTIRLAYIQVIHVLQMVLDFHSQSCHLFTNTFFVITFCVGQGKDILADFICIIQIMSSTGRKKYISLLILASLWEQFLFTKEKNYFE